LITIIGIAFYLSTVFYSTLSTYQAGPVFGKYLVENNLPAEDVVIYRNLRSSIDFYAQQIIPSAERIGQLDTLLSNHDSLLVFTGRKGYNEILENQFQTRQVKTFDDFHISTLTGEFLNPASRSDAIDTSFLLVVKQKSE
jgi:hypothetical protein